MTALLRIVLAGALLFGWLAQPARATCELRLVGSGRLGPATELVHAGDHLYVMAGGALLVYDVADPAQPRRVGRLDLEQRVYELSLAGTTLAAAAGEGGLVLIDVADPTRPRRTARLDTPGRAMGVAAQPGRVFVADNDGVAVVGTTDPSHPTLLATLPGFAAEDVAARGDILYTADFGDYLRVFDVADPSRPVQLAVVPYGGRQLELAGNGRTLYLLNWFYHHHSWTDIFAFDVTTPVAPQLRSWLSADDEGDTPFFHDIASGDGRLYVGNRYSGLRVFDFRDVAHPVLEAELPGLRRGADLDYAGGWLFAAVRELGIAVVDATRPASPRIAARRWGQSETWGLALADGVLTVRSDTSLRTFDARNPRRLGPAGALPLPSVYDYPSTPVDVARAGDLVYLPDPSGLRIVDLADPTHPVEIGTFATPTAGRAVAVDGARALLAVAEGAAATTLYVLDLADPGHPVALGAFDPLPGRSPRWLSLDGARAIVSSGSACAIFDLADPAAPELLSTCGPASEGGFVAVEGRWGYGVDDRYLLVVDLEDPRSPQLAGYTLLGAEASSPLSAASAHGRVAIGLSDSSVALVDAAVPALPLLRARRELPAEPAGLALARAHLFVANRELGFVILSDCPFFADGFESGDTSEWSGGP